MFASVILSRNKTMNTIWIVVGVVVLLLLIIIGIYNGLVVARQRVREGWSDIDTQLKRRYDLIPNLVEMVKGYVKHEQETLEKVVEARTAAMNNQDRGETKAEAENVLSGALKSVFALSESYPDLKANQNFLELQNELANTENKIQASRRFYNSMVLALNTKVEIFPSNLIANMFGFKKEAFFELDEASRSLADEAPKVSF